MTLTVRGANEHNLKDVSIDLPKNTLVCFTGVSGSGKSSLVFDTIYAESFRRFSDASQVPIAMMGRSLGHALKRPKVRAITGLPPALGLPQRQGVASPLSTVGTISSLADLLRVYFVAFADRFCKTCDIPLQELSQAQVQNSLETEFHQQKIVIAAPVAEQRKGGFAKEIKKFKELGFSQIFINGKTYDLQEQDTFPIQPKQLNTIHVVVDTLIVESSKKVRLTRALGLALSHGQGVVKILSGNTVRLYNTQSNCPQCGESAAKIDPRHLSHSSLGKCTTCGGTGCQEAETEDDSESSLPADLFPCSDCHGSRLSPDRPTLRILGITFETLQGWPLRTFQHWLLNTLIPQHVGRDKARMKVMGEAQRVVTSLIRLGLGHLTLGRSGQSLAPGDLQKVRLGTLLANQLQGALYVLDEPCQGLSQNEVYALADLLDELVAQGATVYCVEHHPVFLARCPLVVEMGPGAGRNGGTVISQGAWTKKAKKPLAEKITKDKKLAAPTLEFSKFKTRGISLPKINLHAGAVHILRGPSGAGKSTFLECLLWPTLAKKMGTKDPALITLHKTLQSCGQTVVAPDFEVTALHHIRPGSMTRQSRRVMASALEVIPPLRELFLRLPTSQVLGLGEEGYFSWSSALGRCPVCLGRGYNEIPQKYLPPIKITCEGCQGVRLNHRSLIPRFKGYNFAEIMDLTIDEAWTLLADHRTIAPRLSRAKDFGLGYVTLGQGLDTLSGGELQRLTLTLELKRARLSGAWFLLTHPSTGLHGPDIETLCRLLKSLTEKGATCVMIENREEFLPVADVVVEF